MADIADRKTITIQKIELGHLRLTEPLAERISRATGCSLRWLLANDTSVPITNLREEPYCHEDYENAQIALKYQNGNFDRNLRGRSKIELLMFFQRIARSMVGACSADRFPLWIYRMEKVLEALERDFLPGKQQLSDAFTNPGRSGRPLSKELRAERHAPWTLLNSSCLHKSDSAGELTLMGIQRAVDKAMGRVVDDLLVQRLSKDRVKAKGNLRDKKKAQRQPVR